jgi:cbb3-type cytochrome oxidase subunit 3
MNLWTLLFLVLFLGWTYFAFRAGYWARGEADLANLLNRIIPPRDDDDPPEKVKT